MKTCNKFFAELLGTFVLVLGGCGTAIFGHVGFLGVAIAFGLTVVAMAYGIGHISGAHLNPAVSFGVFVNGRMTLKEMLTYWAAQIIGGLLAGAILLLIAKTANMTIGTFAANGYGEFFSAADVEGGYLQTNCHAFKHHNGIRYIFLYFTACLFQDTLFNSSCAAL